MAEIRIPVPPGADVVQSYPVRLPQFTGPLDLLLHLIRRNEVDIRNIPVAEICRQYHGYLVLMEELDLEVAAEFLYVEALLVNIKSQMVLPAVPSEGQPAEDPRAELVRRLLEYRKFKGVAETLHEMEAPRLGIWARPSVAAPGGPEEDAEEVDLSEVSLFYLLTLFKGALERYQLSHPAPLEIEHQKFSIREKMAAMLDHVRAAPGRVPFSEVLRGLSGRAEAIAVFLAVLELLRLRFVRAFQPEAFGEIYLEGSGSEASLEGYEETYR
jgi:segregation and condensation protein A